MANLWRALRNSSAGAAGAAGGQRSAGVATPGGGKRDGWDLATIEDYMTALNAYGFSGPGVMGWGLNPPQGMPAITQTLVGAASEPIPRDFIALTEAAYKSNGVIFACMLTRQLVFSAIRFQWQRFNQGRPSELFGTQDLALLEAPFPGGTTQDLLTRLIQDADLAGNAYWTVLDGELIRLRPDWVQVILQRRIVPGMLDDNGRRPPATLGWKRVGYAYTERGINSGEEPVFLTPGQVCHFAPIPDPEATYRGMSWLTPVIRDVQADAAMTHHKEAYFTNGATPNMVISHPPAMTPEQVKRFAEVMEQNHAGVDNAYKTLHLGGGADATVVGANLHQVEFAVAQGHGETRIAAAAGVPPIIVGLSEGLASATYSNYGQARRRLADATMHPLWSNAAGSLQSLFTTRQVPPGSRLWYDSRDVPFLREDTRDAADILYTQAQTMRQLVDAGYTPDSVAKGVLSGDLGLLVHSGLFSVQLQKAGTDSAGGMPALKKDSIKSPSGPNPTGGATTELGPG